MPSHTQPGNMACAGISQANGRTDEQDVGFLRGGAGGRDRQDGEAQHGGHGAAAEQQH